MSLLNFLSRYRVQWLIITGSGLDDWIYWSLFLQSILITINYNSSKSISCRGLAPFLTGLRVSSLLPWLIGSDLRISHFFSFRCPLISTPQLNTQLNWTTELPSEFSYEWRMSNDDSLTNGFGSESELLYDCGLPQSSSSWGQTPWHSRPEIFLQLSPCGNSPYVTSSRIYNLSCCLRWVSESGVTSLCKTCSCLLNSLRYLQMLFASNAMTLAAISLH
jgi:hypothetical protein